MHHALVLGVFVIMQSWLAAYQVCFCMVRPNCDLLTMPEASVCSCLGWRVVWPRITICRQSQAQSSGWVVFHQCAATTSCSLPSYEL